MEALEKQFPEMGLKYSIGKWSYGVGTQAAYWSPDCAYWSPDCAYWCLSEIHACLYIHLLMFGAYNKLDNIGHLMDS